MKRAIVFALLLAATPMAMAKDTYVMTLVDEKVKPLGQKNACAYEENGYFVTILAPTTDKPCPRTIQWEEWDRSYDADECEYTFPSYGLAIAFRTDRKTACFKKVHVTFNPIRT